MPNKKNFLEKKTKKKKENDIFDGKFIISHSFPFPHIVAIHWLDKEHLLSKLFKSGVEKRKK